MRPSLAPSASGTSSVAAGLRWSYSGLGGDSERPRDVRPPSVSGRRRRLAGRGLRCAPTTRRTGSLSALGTFRLADENVTSQIEGGRHFEDSMIELVARWTVSIRSRTTDDLLGERVAVVLPGTGPTDCVSRMLAIASPGDKRGKAAGA